jgi:hypothetical protein
MFSYNYVLCPGWITSINDMDTHYISAPKLARLYGLRFSGCLVLTKTNYRSFLDVGKYIFLHPKKDGDYTIRAFTEIEGYDS